MPPSDGSAAPRRRRYGAAVSALTGLALCAAACKRGEEPRPPQAGGGPAAQAPAGSATMPQESAGTGPVAFGIMQSGQYTYKDLRIGLGFVKEAEFKDEAGSLQRGLVAGLWLFVKGVPGQDRHIKVRKGERFQAGSHTLEVENINPDRPGSIRLRVLAKGP